MNKKGVSLLIAIVIIIAAVVFNKVISASKEKSAKELEASKGLLVNVVYPQKETIENHYQGTGKLRAVDRFEIVAQVDGQLLSSARKFKEGKSYRKGELMLEIDHQEYKMNLLAQKSEFVTLATSILPDLKSDYPDSYPLWRQYISSIEMDKKLPVIPEAKSEQEQFYLSGKGILSKYYSVKSGEEKFVKYTIRAPFTGVVTSVDAEAGKAVRSGSALGTMISTASYDLEVTIPLANMDQIKVGTEAVLKSSDIRGQWMGKVVRISGDIDEQSQSVKVFIRVSGSELKEGMYLNAQIDQKPLENAMRIPRKMVDNNNRIYIVEDNQLKLVQVAVITKQSDYAIIKSLDEGTAVLATVIKSAYDGMPVRVND
ncbi:HlyD family efflux transporter periplasmic adaptor subunit [Carboxylicivirga sp. A043]|uniref:efflux RND transporter periplasmic adaptor subunit n=1 Tax=Carboxylicivirga litoralis TaxID=2816963 RepID=UPI0021CB7616|nr:HlyD family efflux transporter periplasmic adaptor subunit [Carboxylicivirga sp. A043]MCU4157449.1 HlyD family efflux transporter periplasmic adaptor subunit [Carboxylicivirga sp. A043]